MKRYCPSCMSITGENAVHCGFCGKSLSIQNQIHQLPVMTVLNRRYLVGKVLGAGGFGITYLGLDQTLDIKVAIKEFYPNGACTRYSTQSENIYAISPEAETMMVSGREKFLQEAQMLALFRNEPSIVSVNDVFYANNTAYIVMEYLEGQSMDKYLSSNGPVQDFNTLYSMLRPVMLGLQKVHSRGLIHRDISPSNLMLLPDGRVKLLDFGAARALSMEGTHSLSVILKPGFAPMEQYQRRGNHGPWTDIYSLCASIYRLLTGETPPEALERSPVDSLVPPSKLGADINPAQEKVLLHGLKFRAENRIQSVGKLISDFDKASLKPKPQPNPKQKPEPEPKPKPNPIKSPKALIAAIAAALMLAAVVVIWQGGGMGALKTGSPKQEILTPTPIPTAKPAANNSHSCGENLTWALNSAGTLTISGSGHMQQFSAGKTPWYNRDLNSVVIEPGVLSISDNAFWCERNLESVVIPDSVISIGESAFSNCEKLSSVRIPDSVLFLGDFAFNDCKSLASVTMSNSMTSLGGWAFENCEKLTSITIPSSVIKIGHDAFSGCTALTNVTMQNGITTIGSDAFSNCTALPSLTIPDSVTTIESSAFSGCTALSTNIPNKVVSIGDWAFYGIKIGEHITLPKSLTDIGGAVFVNCPELCSISVEADNPSYKDIDGVLFNKKGTDLIAYPNSHGNTYSIPNTVTYIISCAFCGSASLESITIPDSMEYIGDGAFKYCRRLSDVYYQGTKEQWEKITISSDNFPLLNATIHFV